MVTRTRSSGITQTKAGVESQVTNGPTLALGSLSSSRPARVRVLVGPKGRYGCSGGGVRDLGSRDVGWTVVWLVEQDWTVPGTPNLPVTQLKLNCPHPLPGARAAAKLAQKS